MAKHCLMIMPFIAAGTIANAQSTSAIKASVSQGSEVYETAQFLVSDNPKFSFDANGKLIMTLGSRTYHQAELPMSNGAAMRVSIADYDQASNQKPVKVSPVGFSTMYSAFQVAVPDGVEAYAPTYDSEKKVFKLDESTRIPTGTVLPVGTGVILKNEGSFYFPYTKKTPSSVSTCLTGSAVIAPVSEFNDGSAAQIYSLANEDDVVAFYRYVPHGTVAGKAFYVLSTSAGAKSITFDFGDILATDIQMPADASATGDNSCYNIAGQRIDPASSDYKGIVIINGKKYLKK